MDLKQKKLDEKLKKIKSILKVGKKNSERFFKRILDDPKNGEEIIETILDVRKKYSYCKICFYLSYKKSCFICDDKNRNKNQICVVKGIFDAMNIENTRKYKGSYHVLNGEINIIKKSSPDNLNIESLLKRIDLVKKVEIIIATSLTFEGELTSQYIKNILYNYKNVKISRLAKGIPFGASLDYIDDNTLQSAIENRKDFK